MKNKIAVVIYSFYKKNFNDCLVLIDYVKKIGKDYVLVLGGGQIDAANGSHVLRHDNSGWEFGAYKTGLEYAKDTLGCSCVVVVNDTFLANQGMGLFYVKKIIKNLELNRCNVPVLIGELLEFDTDFRICEIDVNKWIRSSVFGLNEMAINVVIENGVFDACGDLVKIQNGVLDYSINSCVSKGLLCFIENWLGLGGKKGGWHGLDRPEIDDDFLRLKVLSILRERWLSGVVVNSGGRLINIVGSGFFKSVFFKIYRRVVRFKCYLKTR